MQVNDNSNIAWIKVEFPMLTNIVRLSEGGQKLVYACCHPDNGKVVLKIIKPGAEGRIDRELEAVKRLSDCEYIPVIYEDGINEKNGGKFIWIIEQYINGATLSELLRNGPLNKEQLLRLSIELMYSVVHAESKKVVHRDIKPDNIKIDESGKAWLLDFGIARILDMESKTRTDAMAGPHSPGYGAPEQFTYRKDQIDSRSDLFAIGVTLYESATGINPFLQGARDRLEILNRVEKSPLPRLVLDWDVEHDYAAFISSLTQKYPYQRPASCKEAFEWLKEIIDKIGRL